ncbi:hypothetical protein DSECCO2_155550 [anaerobic digester metagenome]
MNCNVPLAQEGTKPLSKKLLKSFLSRFSSCNVPVQVFQNVPLSMEYSGFFNGTSPMNIVLVDWYGPWFSMVTW